jgi:hypothetical protein
MSEPTPTASFADLGIVIVTWNAADVIDDCLGAVLADAPADLEAIIVDNASSDGTPERVRAWCRRDGRVRLVETGRNAGFGAASNIGARATERPFLLFLNPDVSIGAAALGRMLACARADPRVGAVGCRLFDQARVPWLAAGRLPGVAREARDKIRHLVRPWTGVDRTAGDREVEWTSGACLLVRRAALDGAIFDERFFLYFEDKDLCKRIGERGYRLVVAGGAEALHRGGSSARKAAEQAAVAYRESQIRYYAKHRGGAELLVLRVVLTLLFVGRLALGAISPGLTPYAPALSRRLIGVIWRRGGAARTGGGRGEAPC